VLKRFKYIKDRRSSPSTESKGIYPTFLEKLEPRILLSGDGLLSLAAPDPLIDTVSQVVLHAELLEVSEPIEQQSLIAQEIDQDVNPSRTVETDLLEPIFTLSFEDSKKGDASGESADDPALGEIDPAPANGVLSELPDESQASIDTETTVTEVVHIAVEEPTKPNPAVLIEDGSTPIGMNDTNPDSEYATSIEIRGPPAQTQATFGNQVVFVDSTLNSYFQLENADYTGVTVEVISPGLDGIQQITDILSNYQDVSAIHIVSHGAPGQVMFGTGMLDSASLDKYADTLRTWADALTPDGDILFYGCSVAQGDAGTELIDRIAQLTGADVAASTDNTGATDLGGNWILEYQTGSIEADLRLDTGTFRYVLAHDVYIQHGGSAALTDVDGFDDTPGTDVYIDPLTITVAAGPVTIVANNDIHVDDAIYNIMFPMTQDLTLRAGGSVNISANIVVTDGATLSITANDPGAISANRDVGQATITQASGRTIDAGNGTISLTVEPGAAGTVGGITVDEVKTTGTLNVSTAGYMKETDGDAIPTTGDMTTEDDLTAGTLNLEVTAVDATIGEAVGVGNEHLEIAAGIVNATVGVILPESFTGSFVLQDVDPTDDMTAWTPFEIGTINAGSGTVILNAKGASITDGVGGGAANITAWATNLTTEPYDLGVWGSQYGSIGLNATAPIRTDVVVLTATSCDGGLFINEADGLLVNSAIAQELGKDPSVGADGEVVMWRDDGTSFTGNSDLWISLDNGDLVLDDVKAPDQIVLMVPDGRIIDNNQEKQNILGRGLWLDTAGQIGQVTDPIETAVQQIGDPIGGTPTIVDGGLFISEMDGVRILDIEIGAAMTYL